MEIRDHYLGSRSRFSSASWVEEAKNISVAIIGLGGIGSHTALNIARLNPRSMSLVDPDFVDLSNMSGQLHPIRFIGHYKAHSANAVITQFSDYRNTYLFNSPASEDSIRKVTIVGVDSMKARKEIFEMWKNSNTTKGIYIDGRLSIDTLQIYTVRDTKEDIEAYEKTLFSDTEAQNVICSLKQTTYMASMIGSYITNVVVAYLDDLDKEREVPSFPFFIEYSSGEFKLKTEY